MVFGYNDVAIPILFIRIFLSSTTGFQNLNNSKGEPYYILQRRSVLIFYLIRAFLYSVPRENIFSFYIKETTPSFRSIQFSNNIYNYELLQLIYNCLQQFKLDLIITISTICKLIVSMKYVLEGIKIPQNSYLENSTIKFANFFAYKILMYLNLYKSK